jgi:NADH dehydrogenase
MDGGEELGGRRVTLFGGAGFIGRHLVQRLARAGARLRVVSRDPEHGMFLKPMGNPGQIEIVGGDIRDDAAVAGAVAGAEFVVNLVGILYQSGRQTFAAIHTDGARRIAEAAKSEAVKRLVHVSAVGASAASPALYARSKAAGEAAVRAAFPGATIIRPSIVFGPEDDFFNRFATLAQFSPVLPLIGGAVRLRLTVAGTTLFERSFGRDTRFQPVYVGDVAEAMLRAVRVPGCAGITYELGGPHVYTLRDVFELILEQTGRRRLLLPVPYWLADLEAAVLQHLPKPPLTRDQVKLLRSDNVVGRDAPGLTDLGIAPASVESIVPAYLGRYRRTGATVAP